MKHQVLSNPSTLRFKTVVVAYGYQFPRGTGRGATNPQRVPHYTSSSASLYYTRGGLWPPVVLPPAGEAPAKRVMRENDGPQSTVEISEVGGALPHLSAALTSSPAGGGTNPSVTAAGVGDTSPFRGGQCVLRRGRRPRRPAPSLPRARGRSWKGRGRARLVPTLGGDSRFRCRCPRRGRQGLTPLWGPWETERIPGGRSLRPPGILLSQN